LVIIVGGDELVRQAVSVKDMVEGKQEEVALTEIEKYILDKLPAEFQDCCCHTGEA